MDDSDKIKLLDQLLKVKDEKIAELERELQDLKAKELTRVDSKLSEHETEIQEIKTRIDSSKE